MAFHAQARGRGMPFFPNFVLRDAVVWLIVLNVLLVLSVFFSWEVGKKADPFAPAPAGIKPEWYFLFMYQSVKLIPPRVWAFDGEVLGVLAATLGTLVWLLVPFLDRGAPRRWKDFVVNLVGILVLAYVIAFTLWGWLS
jgi:quinol-cytochrome oxidoreductase complex cytochrome b subunit